MSCTGVFRAQCTADKKLCCHREAARCFVSVCIVQYPERSLLLLITSASELQTRTIELGYMFCSLWRARRLTKRRRRLLL